MNDELGIPQGSHGDDGGWMARFPTLPDADVDALLDGEVPDGLEDFAPVAKVAAALRERAALQEAPPMSHALRSQLRGATVVPLDRARLVRRPLIAGAAAAAVVLLALVAGASQEVLPDSVQRVVASAAERVGLHLPSPDDDDDLEGIPAGAAGGPPVVTPGGATPADPGAPGDPATPATPPADPGNGGEGSNGGEGNAGQGVDPSEVDDDGIGDGTGGEQGTVPDPDPDPGTVPDPVQGTVPDPGQGSAAPPGNNASAKGQENGTGTGGAGSPGSEQGQQQGTGTAKGARG